METGRGTVPHSMVACASQAGSYLVLRAEGLHSKEHEGPSFVPYLSWGGVSSSDKIEAQKINPREGNKSPADNFLPAGPTPGLCSKMTCGVQCGGLSGRLDGHGARVGPR